MVVGSVTWGISLPIAGAIAALIAIVTFSYRQTIFAYPHGGGSYIVSRENLGLYAGLTAAASILTDYVLTVAVSVAAGVDAFVSGLPTPSLPPHVRNRMLATVRRYLVEGGVFSNITEVPWWYWR